MDGKDTQQEGPTGNGEDDSEHGPAVIAAATATASPGAETTAADVVEAPHLPSPRTEGNAEGRGARDNTHATDQGKATSSGAGLEASGPHQEDQEQQTQREADADHETSPAGRTLSRVGSGSRARGSSGKKGKGAGAVAHLDFDPEAAGGAAASHVPRTRARVAAAAAHKPSEAAPKGGPQAHAAGAEPGSAGAATAAEPDPVGTSDGPATEGADQQAQQHASDDAEAAGQHDRGQPGTSDRQNPSRPSSRSRSRVSHDGGSEVAEAAGRSRRLRSKRSQGGLDSEEPPEASAAPAEVQEELSLQPRRSARNRSATGAPPAATAASPSKDANGKVSGGGNEEPAAEAGLAGGAKAVDAADAAAEEKGQAHEHDEEGDGKGPRGKGGSASKTARGKRSFGGGRAPKGKAAAEVKAEEAAEAKDVPSAASPAGAAAPVPTEAPATAAAEVPGAPNSTAVKDTAAPAAAEAKPEDAVMEDAKPGPEAAPAVPTSHRQKRQRSEPLPASMAMAAQASGGIVGSCDLDAADEAAGAAGRRTKRQSTAAKGQAVPASVPAAGAGASGPAPVAGAAGTAPVAGTAGAPPAAAAPAAAAAQQGTLESRVSRKIEVALEALEKARRLEAEAVQQLHECVDELYNHPFDFDAYRVSKLARNVNKVAKGAKQPPVPNAPTLASVQGDMKTIVNTLMSLNDLKLSRTEEPLKAAMEKYKLVPPPQAAPPAPEAPASAAPPPAQVVSAFEPTGDPLRDKAIVILAQALGSATPVHPVSAAVAVEAQLLRQLGEPSAAPAAGAGGTGAVGNGGAGPGAAGSTPGEAYLARLRWLCDVLSPDGAHCVPEVARLVLEGRVSAEELVAFDGSQLGSV